MKPINTPPLRPNARKGEFTIIIDTREQDPLGFASPTERGTLATGDYSIKGFEAECCVERKSEDDFLGSISHDRQRFMRELERMRGFRAKAIVVETSYGRLIKGQYRSKMNPAAVIATVASVMVRYGVPIVFAECRSFAAYFIQFFFKRYLAVEGEHALLVQLALQSLGDPLKFGSGRTETASDEQTTVEVPQVSLRGTERP